MRELEIAELQMRLMVEIDRKGATRKTIAALYREAIICGGDAFGWSRVNAAILNRYTVSGLNYIKKLAWGQGVVAHRVLMANFQ